MNYALHIGFTGTQEGMSDRQKEALAFDLSIRSSWLIVFHHGDCVGADEEAHLIARYIGAYIVIHPPIDPRLRAFCEGDEIREPKPYIPRNHDIVDESRLLLAAPLLPEHEQPRSGTWATWRYAREKKVERILLER